MTKVMLVEDDDNLREIYGARLIAEGYEIISARDGEEALALAIKERPDLLISDVMMPKISGFDMLDILRSSTETKNIKVIMMTALSQTEDKDRADKLGADRYLVKSQVTLEDVVKVAKEVLDEEDQIIEPTEPIAPISGVDISLPNNIPTTPAIDDNTQTTQNQTTGSSTDDSADITGTTQGAPLNTNPASDDDSNEDEQDNLEQPEPETIQPTVDASQDATNVVTEQGVESPTTEQPTEPATTPETVTPAPAEEPKPEPVATPEVASTPNESPNTTTETTEPVTEATNDQVTQTATLEEIEKATKANEINTPQESNPSTNVETKDASTPETPKNETPEVVKAEKIADSAQTANSELKTIEDQISNFVNNEMEEHPVEVAETGDININEDGTISKGPVPVAAPPTTEQPTEPATTPETVTPAPAEEPKPEPVATPEVASTPNESPNTTTETTEPVTEATNDQVTAPPTTEQPTEPATTETVTPAPAEEPSEPSEVYSSEIKQKEKKVIQPLNDMSVNGPDLNKLLEKEMEKEQLTNIIQQAGINGDTSSQITTGQVGEDPNNPNNVSL